MAVQPIHTESRVKVKTSSSGGSKSGILAQWVLQPTSSSPEDNGNEVKYTELWKGPYEEGKEILSSIKSGDLLSYAWTVLNGVGSGSVRQIAAPACPTRDGIQGVWRVKGIKVDENKAGDHCLLYLECVADYSGSSEETSTLQEVEDQNVWNIQWQSYTVDPYAFCGGTNVKDELLSPSDDEDSIAGITISDSDLASRANIQKCMNNNPQHYSASNGDMYAYSEDPTNVPEERAYLNYAEGAIYRKKLLQRQALWHYPVLTHNRQWKGDKSLNFNKGTIGGEIDHIVTSLPNDCPFTFPDDTWTWVKIGDSITQTKTKLNVIYTRQETYAGYTNVDENFYGNTAFTHDKNGIDNGRWELELL